MPIRPFSETQVVSFPNLGGLDTTSAPAQVPMNMLTILDNAILSERKTWQKRGGLVQQSSASLPSQNVRKLIDYWRAGSLGTPTQKGVAICGASIFRDDGDNVWDDVSGTISVPTTAICNHAVVGDTLVMAFAATPMMAYTQTGNVGALTGGAPVASTVAEHLNRCWANEVTDPHRIYFTGPTATGGANPTYWSIANGGGSFYVEEDDGDPIGITAMFKHMGNLYVSKLTKIYRIEGRNAQTFRPVLVADGVGCVSQNGVVAIGSDVIFPSLVGFHSLAMLAQGGGTKSLISGAIHKSYQNDISLASASRIQGMLFPEINSIIWGCPLSGQGSNTIAYVYSLTTGAWSRFTNFQCDAVVGRYNSTTKKIELWTGGQNGKVYKYTPTTFKDYGTSPISMRLKSGHIYPDKMFSHIYNYRYFNILVYPKGTSHLLTFSYKLDSQKDSSSAIISSSTTYDQGSAGAYTVLGSGFILGTSVLGEDVFVQPIAAELKGSGRAIEWEIVNASLDQDLEIAGWFLEIDPQATWRDRV